MLLLIVYSKSVFGQVAMNNLELTGTMADTMIARKLLSESKNLNNKGMFIESYASADSSQRIWSKTIGLETKEVADALHQKGRSLGSSGHYNQSINCYEESLTIRLKLFGEENIDVASSFNNIGLVYLRKGEYDKSIECLQKSTKIRLSILGPDHSKVADSYYNLGLVFEKKGAVDDALHYNIESLKIRTKALDTEDMDIAQSLYNIGDLYHSKGDFEKSLEYLNASLPVKKKVLTDKNSEVASLYLYIGFIYVEMHEYEKGIEYLTNSLTIYLNLPNSSVNDIALCYNNIGMAYSYTDKRDLAEVYFLKAFKIWKEIRDPNLAFSYNNLGSIYDNKKEYEKSIEYKKNALQIWLYELGDNHNAAWAYKNISFTYSEMGNLDSALYNLEKALNLYLTMYNENHHLVSDTYKEIGDIYVKEKKYQESVYYYEKSIKSTRYYTAYDFSSVQNIDKLIESLTQLGSTRYQQYILSSEINHLNLSVDLLEQAIAAFNYKVIKIDDNKDQLEYKSKCYSIFETLIKILVVQKNIDKNKKYYGLIYKYISQAKSSQIFLQMRESNALYFSGVNDSLIELETYLRVKINNAEKKRQILLDSGTPETDENVLRSSKIIFDLKQDYETLQKRFETDYPDYYRLKYDLSTVSLQYVQDTLLAPEQALLEYFVGDSTIYLFVVRPDTFMVLEVKRDFPLDDWIEQLRQGIYGYYTAEQSKQTDALKKQSLNQYLEYAPKLYQKLFAPVAQFLPERVILVPDGPLGYIPFDALLTEAPIDTNTFNAYPYLFKKRQFSYTYSATLLKEMCDKKHHREPTKQFAAFAPFYNGNTTQLANMYTEAELLRKDLQPLVYSGAEVAAAAKLMRGEIVAGSSATEARFTSTAGNYRILHLATHGRADNRVGDYAFLAFTEVKDSVENELLYVKDLYNLELNADMVVLSACETGIGKLQRGEGIISLSRAFAYAGAKSILTTLWEVNDKSTSELMRYFYRELRKGKSKDAALHAAREAYFEKATGRGGHPFFWAAFVPVGDMRPVFKAKK